MLRNVLLIAHRDYRAYVGRKRFWISLILTPSLILAFVFVPGLLNHMQSSRKYAVLDHSGWILKSLRYHVATTDFVKLLQLAGRDHRAGVANNLPPTLRKISTPAAQLTATQRHHLAKALVSHTRIQMGKSELAIWRQRAALIAWYHQLTNKSARKIDPHLSVAKYHMIHTPGATKKKLEKLVSAGKLFAYFVLGHTPLKNSMGFQYGSRNLTDNSLRNWFVGNVNAVVRRRKIEKAGLPANRIHWIETPVVFASQLITRSGSKQVTTAEKAAQWLPVGYVYLLFISILSISQVLMMATIEEKSSRIAEVLLASISPWELMGGKILGSLLVGLTMLGSWLTLILLALGYLGGTFGVGNFAEGLISAVSPAGLAWFFVYFILGYLFYGALLGAIGASVSNAQEAQPYLTPVMLFLMTPLILMVPIIKDPTAEYAKVLSFVPPLTPFVMMNRLNAPPSLTDYILTTLILGLSAGGMFYCAGRIFSHGLLHNGAPPKLSQLLAWARTRETGMAGSAVDGRG